MSKIIANQTKIIKAAINNPNTETLKYIREENINLNNQTNRKLTLQSQLSLINALTNELEIDLETLTTAIHIGKSGIIHSHLLGPSDFIRHLRDLEQKGLERSPIALTEENYQILISISTVKIIAQNGKIIYYIKTPILSNKTWDLIRLYPIPRYNEQIKSHTIIIIPHYHYIKEGTNYITVDSAYLDKQCKEIHDHLICKQTLPTHSIISKPNCEAQLLLRTNDHPNKCIIKPVNIDEITFIHLSASNRYIVIPEKALDVQVVCEDIKTIKLVEPTLISKADGCTFLTSQILFRTMGRSKNLTFESIYKNIEHLNFTYNLNDFKHIVPKLPLRIDHKIIENYNTQLTNMDQQLEQVISFRRIKTWKEMGISTLQYIGYLSIILVGLWLLKKTATPRNNPRDSSTEHIELPNIREINIPTIEPSNPRKFKKRVRFGGPNLN
ncbi:hypothetical protein ANTQUA_LOCUS7427 [Anthophora quadrimaculata]